VKVVHDNQSVGDNYQDHFGGVAFFQLQSAFADKYDQKRDGSSTIIFYQSSWAKQNTPHKGSDMEILFFNSPKELTYNLPSGITAALYYMLTNLPPSKAPLLLNFCYNLRLILIWLVSHLSFAQNFLHRFGYVVLSCNQTLARGSIRLASKNLDDFPIIDPQFWSKREDMDRVVEAMQNLQKIFKQKSLTEITYDTSALMGMDTRQKVEDSLKSVGFPTFHPSGTCKMGVDSKKGVVDATGKVYGVSKLRIADASIMPDNISGNINSACMMIGARIAHFINQDKN